MNMKRIISFALIMTLMASGFVGEKQAHALSEEVWGQEAYTDVFGDPTEEYYIRNLQQFSGTFNNETVDNAPLSASIVIDNQGIYILLLENGTDRIKNYFDKDQYYTIAVKEANGNKFLASGVMIRGDSRIAVAEDDCEVILRALSNENGQVVFYLERNDQPMINYRFTAQCGNLSQLIYERSIDPEYSPLHVNFEQAVETNPECVAWIYSPDTVINYPVVFSGDNFYYLDHNFNGEIDNHGSIFIDARNDGRFSDQNTVIWGMNMNDGMMLASLCKYQDSSYYNKHPVIYLSTPDKNYRLDLIAGFATDVGSFAYTMNFTSREQFEDYIALVKELSTFKSNVEVKNTDKIVTLSTSTNRGNNFVAIGKLTQIH